MVSHRSCGAQLAEEESSSSAPKGSKEKKAGKYAKAKLGTHRRAMHKKE